MTLRVRGEFEFTSENRAYAEAVCDLVMNGLMGDPFVQDADVSVTMNEVDA